MHDNLRECFGTEWLRKQKIGLTSEVLSFGQVNVHTAFTVAINALSKIDGIVGRLKYLQGFELWLKEASTAKADDFPNILFELYCFDNLKFTPETILLKPNNSEGRGVEALLKTKEKDIYIEMLSITDIQRTSKRKVNKFFDKARKKFTDKNGILFIDISRFNNVPNPSSPYIILAPKIAEIKDEIIKRFNYRTNEKTEAIVLVNLSWATNPDRSWDIFFDKRFLLLAKPEHKGGYGHENKFWESVFKVDHFHLGNDVL